MTLNITLFYRVPSFFYYRQGVITLSVIMLNVVAPRARLNNIMSEVETFFSAQKQIALRFFVQLVGGHFDGQRTRPGVNVIKLFSASLAESKKTAFSGVSIY